MQQIFSPTVLSGWNFNLFGDVIRLSFGKLYLPCHRVLHHITSLLRCRRQGGRIRPHSIGKAAERNPSGGLHGSSSTRSDMLRATICCAYPRRRRMCNTNQAFRVARCWFGRSSIPLCKKPVSASAVPVPSSHNLKIEPSKPTSNQWLTHVSTKLLSCLKSAHDEIFATVAKNLVRTKPSFVITKGQDRKGRKENRGNKVYTGERATALSLNHVSPQLL